MSPKPDDADRADRQALDELGARIDAARGTIEGRKPTGSDKYKGLTLAWRMIAELVSSTAVGFAIGYGLDALFGTAPALMLVFVLFGVAAGFRMVVITAGLAKRRAETTTGVE